MCMLLTVFGVVGGLVGGPRGFLIGIGLAFLLTWLRNVKDSGGPSVTRGQAGSGKEAATVFFNTFFACAAQLATADGRVSAVEIKAVEQVMAQLGITGEARVAAIAIFRAAKAEPRPVADYVQPLAKLVHHDPEVAMVFLQGLVAIAVADGGVSAAERGILDAVAAAFGLSAATVDRLLGSSPGGRETMLQQHYEVLDCTPEMTDAEIKQRYRQKCQQYHPDKIQAKGVPDEFVQLGTEKLQQFNAAYNAIEKARACSRN